MPENGLSGRSRCGPHYAWPGHSCPIRLPGHASARRRRHAVPPAHRRLRVDVRGRRPALRAGRPRGAHAAHQDRDVRDRAPAAARLTSRSSRRSSTIRKRHPTTCSSRPSCSKNACIAAGGILPSCQDTGTAIVKGKKGELVLTGGGDREAIARGIFKTYAEDNLRYSQMAPHHDVRGEEHRHQPARRDRDRVGRRRRVQAPLHGEGRRLGQQEPAVPGDEGAAQSRLADALARREAAHARHRRVPAVPPRARDRRHVGRADAQDREARVGALPRRAARHRQRARARLPRRRARATGAEAHPGVRHRRAVRRQVLLPRRARDPPAAPRRVVPGRARGVVLGRPSVARQDHRRRRVPRAARDRSREVPPRRHRRAPRRRGGRAHRPHPTDGGDPRDALAATR